MPMTSQNLDPLTSRVYNSVWQLRADAWVSLAEVTRRLVTDPPDSAPNGPGASLPEPAGADPGAGLPQRVEELLRLLEPIENCWAFPGRSGLSELRRLHRLGDPKALAARTAELNRALVSGSYRTRRPYFEVLVVGEMDSGEEEGLREQLRRLRRPEDEFRYDIVTVASFEDAVIAALVNFDVQAVVIRHWFANRSRHDLSMLQRFFHGTAGEGLDDQRLAQRARALGARLAGLRPQLDLYLITETSAEEIAGQVAQQFTRVFYTREGLLELHLSILQGVTERYRTPFFAALRDYSHRPTGVFHALPISRGASVTTSHWIPEMADFYGMNIFLGHLRRPGLVARAHGPVARCAGAGGADVRLPSHVLRH